MKRTPTPELSFDLGALWTTGWLLITGSSSQGNRSYAVWRSVDLALFFVISMTFRAAALAELAKSESRAR